jgi:hypothetical protein
MYFKSLLIAGIALVSAAGSVSASTLIHHYEFNGDAVTDSVGGIDGSLVGDAVVEDGYLKLDGAGDYAQLDGHVVPLGAQTVILSFQRFGKPGTYGEIISQGFSGSGYYIGYQGTDTIRLSDAHQFTGITYQQDSAFHQFALVSGAGGASFYIDGTLVYESTVAPSNTLSGTATRFGNQFGGFAEYMQGNLDYVAIFDGALTEEEIRAFGPPAVPLPASLPFLLVGVAGLAAFRRRAG